MPTSTANTNKRNEIIEVASKLFYEQGYHRTGVQQIIEGAGAAKGTFYAHFKSKEELGVIWLRTRHTKWNTSLVEFLKDKDVASEKILAVFDFLGKWMKDCDFRGCAFLNTLAETPDPNNPLRNEIAGHKQKLLELFQRLIAEHQTKLPKDKCQNLAASVFLLFEGTLVEMQNFRDTWPLEAAKSQLARML
ncbi:TetR/AcrR family transcriptional regulator [Rubellicoccus peritrichatus]|uniref:TetR/AcrR family transcriptional regulator n=1 Tax=Rubellicoccus peritrichatus TaxID=3080537 RepID=A0AAQ3LFD5_9BACT|nr:TetR/AcrR family transcriptional regulator [Puniceicoccus sp. CR14]WOO40984.1 TetR/AcrR family transcriptional regulator [Puniceicoccus sp. CR14]